MLRGTLVKINDTVIPKHLAGGEGIVLERMTNSGYLRVLERSDEGWLTDVCYEESALDIVEPPIDL